MNRIVLPPLVVAVTLTILFGLLNSVRILAQSMPETAVQSPNDATVGDDFKVDPLNQGQFTQASATAVFKIEVTNTGDAPTDTYELQLSSAWTAALFGPDGTTLLTDTNGSGDIDTGVVAKNESFLITAKVQTPPTARVGDDNAAVLHISSTLSPTLSETSYLRSAIPAPFAQSLFQQATRNMNLVVARPTNSWLSQTTPDYWYSATLRFPDLAMAETALGYFYLWPNLRHINEIWRAELEYQFTDKAGQPVSNIVKLTDLSSVTEYTEDTSPAVAVAPNGNIGVTWYRLIDKADTSKLYNVYLSILDPSGQPVTDTINVTNNSDWRLPGQSNFDVPAFRSPRIAATGDDKFFVAWERSVLTYTEHVSGTETMSETHNLDDIYYAVYDTEGLSVTDTINVSNNVPSQATRSLAPAIAAVNADRVFLTWAQRRPPELGGDDILFTVIDSSNAEIEPPTAIAEDAPPAPLEWSNFDVVELSNGNILAAWEAYGCPDYEWSARIRYAVFKGNNYNRIGQPACLPATIDAVGGDGSVSLVADNQSHAILTWSDRADDQRKNLYYALLNANGNVATDPMIFVQNGSSSGLLGTGFSGYASASHIFLDASVNINPPSKHENTFDPVAFTIDYGNQGAVTGTDAVLTLTLAPSLTYLADNGPTPPVINGQNITWNLTDVLPWSQESFEVQITVSPTVRLLQSYGLTATITVGGQEVNLDNNVDSANVVYSRQNFLPLIIGPD